MVGATDWCTHPADLGVTRVRGTKNQDLAKIATLLPDLVVANKEENRELDVRRLRERGVPVWVTEVESVPRRSGRSSGSSTTRWTGPGRTGRPSRASWWCGPPPPVTARVAIPIWRDPWMVVGGDTFTSDLARRLGWANAFHDRAERYPRVDVTEIDRSRSISCCCPTNPCVLHAEDSPEMFSERPPVS